MTFIYKNKLYVLVASAVVLLVFTGFLIKPAKTEPVKIEITDTIPAFSFTFPDSTAEKIDGLFTKMHKYNGFNGAVLIGQKDSIYYTGSFGFANYRERDSLSPNKSFQLASVSKQFTAVAILQLYQKRKLNLTDTIQCFFPKFPYKDITVHQLLVHRSGLPNYHYFFQHIPTTYDTIITNRDVVNEMIDKQPEKYYSPNRRYQYSNTGYALLAAIVEQVSGLPFDEYAKKNIFEPLGMKNSFVYLHNRRDSYPDRAQGYLYRWRMAEDNYLDCVSGDKGVYSSLEDLFAWDQGLYKGTIIHPDTLALAFEPMGKPKHFRSNYGYGWRMFNYGQDTTKILYHAGWWHGFKSLLIRVPKDNTTIVVLKNRSTGAGISARRLLKYLYPQVEKEEIPIEENDSTLIENETVLHKEEHKKENIDFDHQEG